MSVDKKLLSIYMQDSDLFGKSLKEVDSDFFDGPYSKVYHLLKTYYTKYKKLPSLDIFEEQLFKQKDKIFKDCAHPDDLILSLRTETALTDKKDLEFLTEEIKKRRSKSLMEKSLREAVAAAKNDDISQAANLMQEAVNSIRRTLTNDLVVHTSNHDYATEVLDKYEETEKSPNVAWGVKTGFHKLDQATFGMKGGEMLAIAARHGNGKSIWLLSTAVNMFRQGYNVVYVSLEMPTSQMWHRTAACYANLPINSITEATLNPEQKVVFEQAMKDFAQAENRFEIIDAPHLTVPTIASEINIIADKHKPDVLIIDYLGIVKPSINGLQDNLAQASVVEELRALARQRNIPILTAVQLNREPGKGKNKTKGTERLARSDSIGATVDVALQIEEIDVEESVTKLSDKIKIYVTKNRKGPAPFMFEVRKNFKCSRFEDWDPTSWSTSI